MEEKRKDLKSSKQKLIIADALTALSKSHPSFYYLSTIEVAAEVKDYIHQPSTLSVDDYRVVKDLSRRDIQILLSLH